MMTSLILSAAFLAQGATAPLPEWVRVSEGQGARIDCVTPDGRLAVTPVFRLLEEAMAYSVLQRDRTDARKQDDPEGLVLLGHNTAVRVLRLHAWRDDRGRVHAVARVKILGGTLRGEDFWTSAKRMRPDNEGEKE